MSGENVPYHLRQNKYVERLLFLELLNHVSRYKPIKNYSYVSMGGKYLEDFKLMHEAFGLRELYSIEVDAITHGRQRFNKPLTFIECMKCSTTDFLKEMEQFQDGQDRKGVPQTILWLDFANVKGRINQLRDFETAIAKMIPYDIAKITLNANISTILSLDKEGFSQSEKIECANDKLRRTLSDYCPPQGFDETNLHDKGFSELLISAVDRAGLKGMKNKRGMVLHPLAAFRYNDGHHSMVTYTIIILPKTELATFEASSQIKDWPYYYNSRLVNISVPDLSLKERMFINERIFSFPVERLHKNLPFKLDQSRDLSLAALKSYIEHYRRYPNYVRVAV